MKSEFSEFTYGYTLIEELSKIYNFKSAPVFPSLIEEGTVGGYDSKVNIDGSPFFLQFKKSDFLSTKSAKHYNKFGTTYYRFNLHALRYSKQHDLLLALESSKKNVFYVAPKFYENQKLNNFYLNKKIVEKSIWVRPSSIGSLPDDKAHSVCFNSSGELVYFCSDPIKLEIQRFALIYENLLNIKREKEENQKSDKEKGETTETEVDIKVDDGNSGQQWEILYEEMIKIASSLSSQAIEQFHLAESNNLNYIQKSAKLARFAFGCELLII
jgi:hypothetical protein